MRAFRVRPTLQNCDALMQTINKDLSYNASQFPREFYAEDVSRMLYGQPCSIVHKFGGKILTTLRPCYKNCSCKKNWSVSLERSTTRKWLIEGMTQTKELIIGALFKCTIYFGFWSNFFWEHCSSGIHHFYRSENFRNMNLENDLNFINVLR